MLLPHEPRPADDISNEAAIQSWDEAAEEFTHFFAEGEEFYHKHLINPAVLELLDDIEGKTVLDLACGEGHLARDLAERTRGNVHIFGIDASQRMIKIARAKSQAFRDCLTFQQADTGHLDPFQADFFDLAICNMALMDIKDYAQAIREVARTLKVKGQFVFSILHPCFMTPGSGWIRDEDETITGWRIDHYFSHLAWQWTIKKQMTRETYCFHRPLSDYVSALRAAGFVIADMREPEPTPELIQLKPRLIHNRKRGDFLVIKSILFNESL
jgi:ubiquinone/menaquinone biosynthesis C-methylase UbiE